MTQAMFRQRVRGVTRGSQREMFVAASRRFAGLARQRNHAAITWSRYSMTPAIRTRRCRTQWWKDWSGSASRARV